jgi:hypothetical protein
LRHRDHSAENSLLDEYAPNQDEEEEFVADKKEQGKLTFKTTQAESILIKNLEIKLPPGLTLRK